jgi:type IV pilus assembly protein PilF
MILKYLGIICLTLGLTACMSSDNDTAKNAKRKSELNHKPVADFKKAALINVEMGEKYLAQGQVARAKQKFIHALELKPKLPEAHSSIGYFYEKVGDLVEAEEHYRLSIDYADGSKGRYYNNYGTFLCRQKRYKEADKAFNQAINDKKYIKTAEAYENAGLCALQEPNIEKAYTYLQTAVKRDPSRTVASLELAELELKRKNYLAAKYYLDNFKLHSEPTSRSLWLAIQVNSKLGNSNEVASSGLQLKSMFPKSEDYKLFLESTYNG